MLKYLITILLFFILLPVFGCFIVVLTDGKNVLVGNHEDWYARDAEITFVPASGKKYGMVYFDFTSEKTAQGGMNTAGLFFDATRTPNAPYPDNESKADCHCYIWTKILADCATVDEAIADVKKFKIPELEDIHILFADKSGQSAIIGVYDNRLQVHRRTGNFQLLTNFNPSNPSYGGESFCQRYATADSLLHHDSTASVDNISRILSKTHQDELTIYSNIYNLTTGDVYVYSLYSRKNFTNYRRINLATELKKGRHATAIIKLFDGKIHG